MGRLFKQATERNFLRSAWIRIRSNGLVSSSDETVEAIKLFERNAESNIHRIQRLLRKQQFQFDPQKGVLKRKNSGGYRGIVMASVHNRIVERAWLDCLQNNCEFIRKIIDQATSVGGVPDRSVPHGLALIRNAFNEGKIHFIRSDISGFFDNIPRERVLKKIATEIDDELFLTILRDATTVTLANEKALGENRRVFPEDDRGVAQGSPLSPLFGNILLNHFDLALNSPDVCCVRFVDDFVLLSNNESLTHRSFNHATSLLKQHNLTCYDPFADRSNEGKASVGEAEKGFVFLGYDIRPGLFQPSRAARIKLERTIANHITAGRRAILEVKRTGDGLSGRQRYTQTLTLIDRVVRGWGEAFSYGNSPSTIDDLDVKIEKQLQEFRRWFSLLVKDADWKLRRRMGGVCLLSDVKCKSLDELPFKLEKQSRFVRSNKTITISTDGSVISSGRRKGKDQGPGGWAFIVHETNEEFVGSQLSATNNQMELRAVIEAIRFAPQSRSIIIRTDSQYVSATINDQNVIKTNNELWNEYREVSKDRQIKITWVKGHAGDSHNERVDKLASKQARSILTNR